MSISHTTQTKKEIFFLDVTQENPENPSPRRLRFSELPTLILPAARKKRSMETIYLAQPPLPAEQSPTLQELPQPRVTQELHSPWTMVVGMQRPK